MAIKIYKLRRGIRKWLIPMRFVVPLNTSEFTLAEKRVLQKIHKNGFKKEKNIPHSTAKH
jgi:hypothetical protein